MAAVNKNDDHINTSPENSSRGHAALEGGRHETGGLTGAKNAGGKSSHMDGDVPPPGNANLGTGGATSMANSDTGHPGAGSTPAAAFSAGSAKQDANDPRDNPSASKEEGKGMSVEEANTAGDGTFGDGKFDAAAPGAAAKAQQLEAGARKEVGEEGKIHVSVN